MENFKWTNRVYHCLQSNNKRHYNSHLILVINCPSKAVFDIVYDLSYVITVFNLFCHKLYLLPVTAIILLEKPCACLMLIYWVKNISDKYICTLKVFGVGVDIDGFLSNSVFCMCCRRSAIPPEEHEMVDRLPDQQNRFRRFGLQQDAADDSRKYVNGSDKSHCTY